MQAWLDAAAGAFQLLVVLIVGWFVVWFVSQLAERRLRRKGPGGPGLMAGLGWLWEYSNVIGIPTMVFGAVYLVWTLFWGPGLSAGPTMMVILLMTAAGFLIGFGPGLRR
jgi:hypothetical protein